MRCNEYDDHGEIVTDTKRADRRNLLPASPYVQSLTERANSIWSISVHSDLTEPPVLCFPPPSLDRRQTPPHASSVHICQGGLSKMRI